MKLPALNVGIIGIAFALGALVMFLYMDLGNKSTEDEGEIDAGEENQVVAVEPQREGFANSDTPPPERAKVVRVFDGLTIGLDSGHVVRYLGVRLPSVGQSVQCFGKEALAANEGMIGKEVRLEADPILEKAQDGAWVRYVWVEEGDGAHETLPSVVTQGADGEYVDGTQEEVEIDNAETAPELFGDEATSGSVKGSAGAAEVPEVAAELEPGVMPVEDVTGSVGGEVAGDVAVDKKQVQAEEVDEGEDGEEVKEYLVSERIIELGLGFPLLSEEMVHHSKLFAAARFSSATKQGLWGACKVTPDEQNFFHTQELTECIIKGAKLVGGKTVYRTPECQGYQDTVILRSQNEKWFCSVGEAESAGFERGEDCMD